jgi:hypothetical protein
VRVGAGSVRPADGEADLFGDPQRHLHTINLWAPAEASAYNVVRLKLVRLGIAPRHRGGFRQFDIYIHILVFAAEIKVTGGEEDAEPYDNNEQNTCDQTSSNTASIVRHANLQSTLHRSKRLAVGQCSWNLRAEAEFLPAKSGESTTAPRQRRV